MDPQVAQAFTVVNKILVEGGCKHYYLGQEEHLILFVKEKITAVFSGWPEHGFDNLPTMTKEEAIIAAEKIENDEARDSVLRKLKNER